MLVECPIAAATSRQPRCPRSGRKERIRLARSSAGGGWVESDWIKKRANIVFVERGWRWITRASVYPASTPLPHRRA